MIDLCCPGDTRAGSVTAEDQSSWQVRQSPRAASSTGSLTDPTEPASAGSLSPR